MHVFAWPLYVTWGEIATFYDAEYATDCSGKARNFSISYLHTVTILHFILEDVDLSLKYVQFTSALIEHGGETFPAFPAHTQPATVCIWQEAHAIIKLRPFDNRMNDEQICFWLTTCRCVMWLYW